MAGWMTGLLLVFGTASAGSWDCEDCCRDAGLAGCPTRLRIYGDGSLAVQEGPVWRLKGLWHVDCDEGVWFEEGSTAVIGSPPRSGEVIRLASPVETVRCFEQGCADRLPATACLVEHQGGLFRLIKCDDGEPLTAAEMLVPSPSQSTPPPRSATEPRAAAPLPPITQRLEGPIDIPEPPREGCQTSALVAEEADRRLVMGDAARLSGDHHEAIQEYIAAITMDRCSVNGWASLGSIALSGGRLPEARTALNIAIRLDQTHYGAMTDLGEVLERMGQPFNAADAYRAALAIRPDHGPAARGLARTDEP